VTEPAPSPTVVTLPADGETRAVVLVLHGGKAASTDASEAGHLSVVRMVPFAAAIHARSRGDGVAVWRLRYRVRGWNGAAASPVADARWALDEVRRRHGDVPVILLGHSMGGRTAIRVADDPAVRTVVALAPWLPTGEPVESVRGRRIVIAHATHDRWTSPQQSRQWADRARPLAARMLFIEVRRAGHFMLRRSGLWTSLATAFVLEGLTDAGVAAQAHDRTDRGPGTNLLRQAADGAPVLTT
jgi:pimeloyl-ACP methyl ester carboxylesterase